MWPEVTEVFGYDSVPESVCWVVIRAFLLMVTIGVLPPGVSLEAQEPDSTVPWWAPYDHLPAGVWVVPVDSLYGFEASTSREVGSKLREFGPVVDGRRFHGRHQVAWEFRFEWSRPGPGLCEPTDLRILARSVIALPALINLDSVDAELRHDWHRYFLALRDHELGHRQILEDHLIGYREHLIAEPPRPCEQFPEAFQPIHSISRVELRRRTVAYDEETRHGVTQGAVWPPPGERGGR